MTPLNPTAIPHSRIALPSVSLLRGKVYTPSTAHKPAEYLNGRNGLLAPMAFCGPACVMLLTTADDYQRDAIAEANAMRADEEPADDLG